MSYFTKILNIDTPCSSSILQLNDMSTLALAYSHRRIMLSGLSAAKKTTTTCAYNHTQCIKAVVDKFGVNINNFFVCYLGKTS